MSDIDELIRGLYEHVPTADEVERHAVERARARLLAASGPSGAGGRPPRRRPSTGRVLRLAAVAGLVAVVLLVLGALLPSRFGDGASHLPVPSPAPASAQTVLAQAAHAVARQPWRPLRAGEWGYFRFVESFPGYGHVAGKPKLIDHDWIAADGAARFVQPRDVLLWAASPAVTARERANQRHGSHLLVQATAAPWRQFGLDYEQLIHLPTDPGRLRRFLQRHDSGHSVAALVTYAAQLIREPFLPPRLTAAFYHVIAGLRGVRFVGMTVDPLGRAGIAVSLASGSGERTELIFDPKTGVLLSERILTAVRTQGVAPGTVIAWYGIDDQAVVHSDHQIPAAAGATPRYKLSAYISAATADCGHVDGTVAIGARHVSCGRARDVARLYLRGVTNPLGFRCVRHSSRVANGWWASCSLRDAYIDIAPE